MKDITSNSQKRCTQCFESKPLDIIYFRYKNTEKRWVSKCKKCERTTRNKQNNKKKDLLRKRRKEREESISVLRVSLSEECKLDLNLLSELLGTSILEQVQNAKIKKDKR